MSEINGGLEFQGSSLSSIVPKLQEQHISQKVIDRFTSLDKSIKEAHGGEYGLVDHIRDQINEGVSVRSLSTSLGVDRKRFKTFAQAAGITYPDRATASASALSRKWKNDEGYRATMEDARQRTVATTKSEAFKAAQSQRLTDYYQTHPEALDAMSEKRKEIWRNDPNAQEKKDALIARANTPEARAAQRAAASKDLTERWKDEDFRKRNSALSSQRIRDHLTPDPDFLKNFREASRVARLDPEMLGRYKIPTIHGERRDVGESQSIWEANMARVLTAQGVKFDRRVQLTLSNGHLFSLDFMVYPEGDVDTPTFFEIMANPLDNPEGWYRLEQAKKDYPNLEFVAITPSEYRRIEREFRSLIESDNRFIGWETYQDNIKTSPEKWGARAA